METTPAGGRPSPTEAVEICPQGLLVFTGSSEKDSNLAKQFWITSSMYPTNESQLVMSRGSRQRLPVARVSKGGSGSEKICFRPCFIEKNKSPDVTAETPRTQGSEEKEKYLQKKRNKTAASGKANVPEATPCESMEELRQCSRVECGSDCALYQREESLQYLSDITVM
ncbi:UPF0722 protein C11orf88 homolog isoform X3 [Suricata suricatta]|uniref:UPF0722 protein C11orf88 homolog isoform X3 n=1 Tax=Suricata suricatta TaxID=37032 RepID=UPI0011565C59|nr:UPF0722 protein C11orf88 homolog isoform X3 [Suricata suricatta]